MAEGGSAPRLDACEMTVGFVLTLVHAQPALWDNYFTRFVLGQTAFDAPIGTLTDADQQKAIEVLEGMALVIPASEFGRNSGDLNAVFGKALGWCAVDLPKPQHFPPLSNSTELRALINEHNKLDKALYEWATAKWNSTWAPLAQANATLSRCEDVAKENNWPSVVNPMAKNTVAMAKAAAMAKGGSGRGGGGHGRGAKTTANAAAMAGGGGGHGGGHGRGAKTTANAAAMAGGGGGHGGGHGRGGKNAATAKANAAATDVAPAAAAAPAANTSASA
jgi:hypothetical protein